MNSVAGESNLSAFYRWINNLRLRAITRVGAGARLQGRADIGGGGKINIGDGFFLLSQPVQSHMFSMPGAVISIGDGVQISYGAAIAAQRCIEIGSNTIFGPFAVIMDNDFHRVGDRNAAGEISPVRIGSNVTVGARVTILRGSVIGDNVRIMSGSMVSGVVPSGVTVGGVPARVMVASGAPATSSIDMAALVQSVLSLDVRPRGSDGPEEIPAWDSLGTLRLLLAIEENHGVVLNEDEIRAAKSVAALSNVVEGKLRIPAGKSVDMPALVQNVLSLDARPQYSDGPEGIPAWDSLGTLRLLLAIEENHGVVLNDDEIRAAKSVAALSDIVERKLNGPAGRPVDMAALVQNVLSLDARPLPSDGPEEIPAWDSLGTLRLLLAIEETYGLVLNEEEIRTAKTIATLSNIVAGKLNG